MVVRYRVQDTFRVPGRGPLVSGLLTEGEIGNGDTLRVEGTARNVQVSFVDVHSQVTAAGRRVGLELTPADPVAVTVGSILVDLPPV